MNIWNIFLTVVIIGNKKAFSYLYSSRNLICFSQPTGDETKDCDQTRGFKTCFTRYNSEGKVTGRGCSTKRSSYIKCETHSYGVTSDKFCYCSRTMCNSSPGHHGQWSPCLIVMGVGLCLMLGSLSSSTLSSSLLASDQSSLIGKTNRKKKRKKLGLY